MSSFTVINPQHSRDAPQKRSTPVERPQHASDSPPRVKRRRTIVAACIGESGGSETTTWLEKLNQNNAETKNNRSKTQSRTSKRARKQPQKATQQSVVKNLKISKSSRPLSKIIKDTNKSLKVNSTSSNVDEADSLTNDPTDTHESAAGTEFLTSSVTIGTPSVVSLYAPITSQDALKAQKDFGYLAYGPKTDRTRQSSGPEHTATNSRSPPATKLAHKQVRFPAALDEPRVTLETSIISKVASNAAKSPSPEHATEYHDLSDTFSDTDDLSDSDFFAVNDAPRAITHNEVNSPGAKDSLTPSSPFPVDSAIDADLIDSGFFDSDDDELQPQSVVHESHCDTDTDQYNFDTDTFDDEFFQNLEDNNATQTGEAQQADEIASTEFMSLPDAPEAGREDSLDSTSVAPFDPIVRSAFPIASRDRSPIIGLSNDTVLRTCFRIGEAINEGHRALRTNQNVVIELYARVVNATKESEAAQIFTLCDLFHDRPPFLKSMFEPTKDMALWEYDSSHLHQSSQHQKKLCRCIGKMRLVDRKLEFVLSTIWEASWNDVDHVRGILCH